MLRKRKVSILLALVIVLTSLQLSFAADLDNLTQYDMNIILNTEEHTVEGEQVVQFTNFYKSDLKELVFHLYPDSHLSYETMPAIGGGYFVEGEVPKLEEEQKGYIQIAAVHINNSDSKFVSDKQILKIPFEKPLKKGEKVEVKIKFKLKIPEGRHRLHHLNGEYSLTNWYPILSIYDEKAKKWDENPYHPIGESNYSDVSNYNVKLTVPKNMVVAPTGSILEEKIEENNRVLNIKAEKVRDFVILMSPNYKVKTKEIDGIKISNYYMLNEYSSKETADMVLDEVVKTVKFMNETVGKYAYDELRIVETNLAGGAMEYPQVIQMPWYSDLEDLNIDEYAPFIIEAAVHETMHQWWYVGVGNNEFKEPFLDESLTVFMTAYYFEKQYDEYHQNGVNYQIRNYFSPSINKALNTAVKDFSDWSEYGRVIYNGKGPGFFQDLRQKIGEEKFIKFLQEYYEKYLFKNATIGDLIDTIGEVAGKETKDIMNKAINDPSYHPENIELNQEERAEIFKRNDIRNLKRHERDKGIVTGSIILRALEGEELIIVQPDYLKEKDEFPVEDFIGNIEEQFKYNYNIEIKVVEESKLTEKDKKENLILIGYLDKHSIMQEMAQDLPIQFSGDVIDIKGISIINKGVSGTFIMENLNNREKLVLIVFLDKNKIGEKEQDLDIPVEMDPFYIYDDTISNYNPLYNIWEGNQFIINVDGIEIKGMYK